MIIKTFELYRPDRAYKFKTDVVRKIEYDTYKELKERYGIDPNFDIKKIYSIMSKLDVSNLSYSLYEDKDKDNTLTDGGLLRYRLAISFNSNPEDLSWGGIYPPKLELQWSILFSALNDEYFLLIYNITKNRNVSFDHFRSGAIWIDGDENLETGIKDMIENYDIL